MIKWNKSSTIIADSAGCHVCVVVISLAVAMLL